MIRDACKCKIQYFGFGMIVGVADCPATRRISISHSILNQDSNISFNIDSGFQYLNGYFENMSFR